MSPATPKDRPTQPQTTAKAAPPIATPKAAPKRALDSAAVRLKEKDYLFPSMAHYYAHPIVLESGSGMRVKELDGKNICVGASTTYEQWLQGTLEIPDPNMAPPPAGANITSLPGPNMRIDSVR